MATAYSDAAANEASFAQGSRGEIEKAYRAARRHSRHVRWLRVGLLFGIAAALLTVVVVNYLPPPGGFRLPGEIGKLVIHGTKITMQQPRIVGFTADSRPYEFTADTAAQEITKPDLMELHDLHANMEMEDKSSVNLTAVSGLYDVKNEMLTLSENIHVASTTGYEGRLSEAVIDMRKGDVISEKPVWVKMLNGFINSKRMQLSDNGSVVRFDGGVAMTLYPGDNAQKAHGE